MRDPARHAAPSPRRARGAAGSCSSAISRSRCPRPSTVGLEYMDWKSGGDTNFAPIATADGQLDCRGFWNKGDERPDKGATFTANAAKCPTITRYVESVGADFGRVRTIKLEPQDHDTAFRSFHRDDNNRFNPDDRGLGGAHLARAHRQPRQLHAADGHRSRRPARPCDRGRACRCTAARASSSTRSASGTSSCTTAPRRGTRSSAASRAAPRSTPGSTPSFPELARRAAIIEVPPDWEPVATRHILGFVTSETFRRPDGTTVVWRSRAHRKRGARPDPGSTLWAPHALGWWIAVLFMVGSACFALGPAARLSRLGRLSSRRDHVLRRVDLLHQRRALPVHRGRRRSASLGKDRHRTASASLGVETRRIDWWAAAVQLVGTLFFNVTTFAAMHTDLDRHRRRSRSIWTPDALGSICFLVASWLAYAEVGHRLISWLPHLRSWRIAALNLVGSVAFGVSAVAVVHPADDGRARKRLARRTSARSSARSASSSAPRCCCPNARTPTT